MAVISKPSGAARLAVVYITAGALLDVWSGIWYWYLSNHPPEGDKTWYWCYGLLLTGAVLLFIGLALGRIGRAARDAEMTTGDAKTGDTAGHNGAAIAPPLQQVVPMTVAYPPQVPTAQVAQPVSTNPPAQ